MKKVFLMVFAAAMTVCSWGNMSEMAKPANEATAEVTLKGAFKTYELNGFKLHVYSTNDALGNVSYIIEGNNGLVVMEYPLFKANEAEFNEYIAKLGKPIAVDLTDYHMGGSNKLPLTMPEGMWAFIQGPVYSGMMKGFAGQWGDELVTLPTQQAAEVPFGKTQNWAGVDFTLEHGAATDFPGASINIGGQVYYTHWAPAQAHMSALQVGSVAAIDAQLDAAKKAVASGCKYFIGGHGGLAEKAQAEFQVAYLTKVKELRASKADAAAFAEALKAAYPNLPGDADALAQALYK